MASQPRPLLGELLLRRGLISSAQLKEALEKQAGTTSQLGEILIGMGAINREQLSETLELQDRLARGEGTTEADA